MKKLHKCAMCGEKISDESDRFVLKEDIEDWDGQKHVVHQEGSVVCGGCLIEFIDDTERVSRTSPQIIYRYVGVE